MLQGLEVKNKPHEVVRIAWKFFLRKLQITEISILKGI